MRTNISKLIDDGTFTNKNINGGNKPTAARTTGGSKLLKQKRGAVNAVVKEEDDGEETEVK